MKYIVLSFLLLNSLNGFADSRVLATVNGTPITQAAVDNFRQHVKKSISLQDALSKIITIEILVSKRLESPIEKESTLQLELDRNRKGIIANSLLEELVGGFTLSPKELQAEYKQQYLSEDALQEYNANHILVKTKAEANTIIVALKHGSNFEELAKQHSTGPSGKNGGALGWFSRSKMVKPFSDATVALKKGDTTLAPVKTRFGWHIIKLNDIRKNTPPSLKSVADKIKRRDAALKLQVKLLELQNSAVIEVKNN